MKFLCSALLPLVWTLREATALHDESPSQTCPCPYSAPWRQQSAVHVNLGRMKRSESRMHTDLGMGQTAKGLDRSGSPAIFDKFNIVRGGANEVLDRFNLRRGVNRKAIPAEEALSRYPTLETPGGLVRFLDYVGTVSFAMSGAATAGMRGMNLLGCVMVGAIAATGGGTTRDLLLGQTPVFWLVEVEYVGICITTALATFFLWPILSRVSVLSHMGTDFDGWLSQALDTIGLASFAVVGTQHGIRKGCHPLVTIIICMVTCSGGGIIRDVLTSAPVLVLSAHTHMYVSTTAIGSTAYLLARRLSEDPLVRISAGFLCVIVLRMLASVYNLRLPTMVKRL